LEKLFWVLFLLYTNEAQIIAMYALGMYYMLKYVMMQYID